MHPALVCCKWPIIQYAVDGETVGNGWRKCFVAFDADIFSANVNESKSMLILKIFGPNDVSRADVEFAPRLRTFVVSQTVNYMLIL